MVTAQDIKQLREETGVSIALCKAALEEAGGDHAKASEILTSKGAAGALKKADRTLGAGTVAAYVHSNKNIGAMIKLESETDFVAGNSEFQALAYDIAMHISALAPENVETLLEQPFVKDGDKTVKQLIEAAIQKFRKKI